MTQPQVDAAAATTGGSVLRGGLWNMSSRILPQVYLVCISVAAARFLGPDGMGRQSFIAFVSISVTMLLSEGLSVSLSRYVGETLGRRQAERLPGLVRWSWTLALAGGAIGFVALATAAILGADPASAWVVAGVATALGTLHSAPNAVLVGCQRYREASLVGLITGGVGLPATVAVLAAGGGITGMFAVAVLVSGASVVWTTQLARRILREVVPGDAPSPTLQRDTARYAAWSTIGVLLTLIVYRRSEFLFLDWFSTDAEIAIYSICFAAVNALILAPEGLAAVALPAFATLFGAGQTERIRSGYSRALRLMSLLALPICAFAFALGPEAIRLVYGSDYADTKPVFRVMVLVFPLIPLMNVSTSLLTGLGKVRIPLVLGAIAAVANVTLALLLVPPYDALGAGLANLGAQAIVAVATIGYSWTIVGRIDWDIASLVTMTIASVAGGGVALAIVESLGGIVGLGLGLVAGLTAFGVAAFGMRVLSANDADWLAATAGPRLGHRFARLCELLARAA